MDTVTFNQVEDRAAFFKDRVNAYALKTGLNAQQVVAHLQELALLHGQDKITGIIDQVVPAYLHSSKMPGINQKSNL